MEPEAECILVIIRVTPETKAAARANPIESVFATVRHRTVRAKGALRKRR
jgi:hypothetical protein